MRRENGEYKLANGTNNWERENKNYILKKFPLKLNEMKWSIFGRVS